MIRWSDDFKIGIEVIDEQHKTLFNIAEKLHELLMLPHHTDRYDEIITLVNELKEYTKFHFNEEEKIMLTVSYNKLFSHKVMHNDFIEKMDSIDIYTVEENQTKYLLELVDYITTWITEHIMKTDKYLGEWYEKVHK